ncbi:MAG: hypothetical protein H8E66_14735 [Planctomycetes bacterium]|nr:hypothetical protein [Planctomycetota bacterium]
MAKKKAMGRPKLPDSQKRKGRYLLKLTDSEYDLIKRVAEPRVGTWSRDVLLKAARRLVK